jgi:hypothetical protein
MSYIIACWKQEKPYGISCDKSTNTFELIPLDSCTAFNKVYSHPYRAGAQQILNWINKNVKELSSQNLSIQDECRFRK